MIERIRMLEARLASAQDAPQEVDAMLDLAWELRHAEPARALELAQTASERSASSDLFSVSYQKGMAVGFLLLGLLHSDLANYDQSLSYLFSALTPLEELKDMKHVGEALDAIALVYSRLGAYQEALQFYEQKLRLVKMLGDKKSEADLLSHIGVVEVCWGDSNRALTYLSQALSLYEELGDLEGQAEVLGTCCSAYCNMEDYTNARLSGEKSAALYQQINSRKGEAEALNNLGEVYLALGDDKKALGHFQKSLKLAGEVGLRYEAAHVVYHIGNIYLQQGELAKALDQYQRGLAVAEEIGGKQLCVEFHQNISEAFKQQGDYEKALDHYERFHRLKEDIFNEAANARLRNLEIAFQAEASRQELQVYRIKTAALNDEIIERKKIEENLRETNEQLRRQIHEREQLISDLDSFSHMVAHDLKNPLQVVIFGSQMLLEMLQESLDEDAAVILRNILQMGHKMRAIIDELLVLASVRQQEITLQPLDMGMLIEDVKARLTPLMEEYNAVILAPDKWPVALGHAPWVEEVWANYISNAIKYGGKPPRIELGATLLGNGYIRFWVRDNGMGLRAEARKKLFTPFKRFSPTQATGHGLGLSIVKRIVEKLGGEVFAESEGLGQGSVFSFTLTDATPFAPPPLSAAISGESISTKVE